MSVEEYPPDGGPDCDCGCAGEWHMHQKYARAALRQRIVNALGPRFLVGTPTLGDLADAVLEVLDGETP